VLRFTASGAVSSPTTLQIRVTRRFEGRVHAGAPHPAGTLTAEEVRENVLHFTQDVGPRRSPCDALVLSGVSLSTQAGLADALADRRALGIARVSVHLGRGDRAVFARSALGALTDAVAVTVAGVQDVADVARLSADGLWVTAVVVLDAKGMAHAATWVRALAATSVSRVVLPWPLSGPTPPPASAVAQVARGLLACLDGAGVVAGIKGLPACKAMVPAARVWRSANRWYVDSEHQRGEALLFFPDVVAFAKGEGCRFCPLDGRCDGAPRIWVDAGVVGELSPPDPPPPGATGTASGPP